MSTNCRLMMMVLAGAAWAACGDNHTQPDAPPATACADGIDNDGDGLVDHPEDPGCESPQDEDEVSPGPECSDGVDNDGDGKTDYPNDPGCLAPNQDDETDDCPDGENCPQCANGIDDDNNGQTDYPNDSGCMAASDPTEFLNNPAACGAGLTIKQLPPNGIDGGMLDATSTSSLVNACGTGPNVPAVAYLLSLPQASVVVASTAMSAVDTVLDLRGANCSAPGSEIACNDNVSSATPTSALTHTLPAGNYYLVVSGADSATYGAYTLKVETFAGEGSSCTTTANCGPGLVCRVPYGATAMVCSKPACSDGVDDDQDGKTDFPTDPGCESATDNDEMDDCPDGANCPACSNGGDDEGDGEIDYPADDACGSAADTSEACGAENDPIVTITGGSTQGTTVGAMNDLRPTCAASSTHSAGDRVYSLTIPAMQSLTIANTNSFDQVVTLFDSTCGGTPVGCIDEPETITRGPLAAGTYYYVVDGWGTGTGAYTINVSGTIASGGRCDAEYTLGGALSCHANNPCEGPVGNMRCRLSICGDGIDNDGDGLMDYPADPGCSSPDGNDESDTCPGEGPGCPQCADGVDNDLDGFVDMDDSNCTAPSVNSEGCASTEPVLELTTAVTTGTTTGATNDVSLACGAATNTAPDHTYSLELPLMRTLTIANSNGYNAAVALFGSSCGGTPIQCRDEPENISLENVPAGTYYYVTDGHSTAAGAYTLTVSGQIMFGASCESPLAQAGAITCGTGFACKGTPGSRVCGLAACRDGIDNDGDGKADFPSDPGCTSINDDDESDDCPDGPNCPVCSDGVDNDGDTYIDYPLDPTCLTASTNNEACLTSEGITALTLPLTMDTTVGSTNDVSLSCGSSSNTAGDKTYSLTVPRLTSLSISNSNSFDAAVALLPASCSAFAPLSCSDEPETVTAGALEAGTYYYVVDGHSSSTGAYTINVSGTIANGESCESPLAASGALSCGAGYACSGTAGARTCQVASCNNGVDDDGDGRVDYPNDPGCATSSDNDETDPAVLPACGNGIDDDGDGMIDYPGDAQCLAASWPLETTCTGEVDPIGFVTTPAITGTTTGRANNFGSHSCQSSSSGEDVAYGITLPVPVASLVVDLSNSGFDTVLSWRNGTCGMQLACDDDSGEPGTQSKLTLTSVAAGTYFIIVDGYSGADGAYNLAVTGTVAAGTACDSPLFASGVLSCPTGTTCGGSPAVCQ